MMKKWLLPISLGVVCVALLIALSTQMRRAAAAERTLRETTLSALSEAAEETQAAVLAMDKLRIASSPSGAAAFTRQIAEHADRARHSLSALPDEEQTLLPVLTWLARLSSLASDDLSAGEDADPSDLLAMQSSLHLLHAELDLARQSLLSGETLPSALPPTAMEESPTAAELTTWRGLPSTEIGSGTALQIAKDFVGAERVVSVAHAPDTFGALPTFGVTVQTRDVQLNLEVTSRGGKVLMMMPETADFQVAATLDEATRSASEFLRSRGFSGMEPIWYQQYDGLCVLTFVHVQDEALIWADRVLVQVRLDTAEVVGIEARNYWQNHVPRKVPAPLLTQQEAQTFLSPEVTVTDSRLCLLPIGGTERLCWQFTLSWADGTYISYIDAFTGEERLLEKIMQLDGGAIAA